MARPRDAARIGAQEVNFARLAKFCASSAAAFLIDNTVFTVAMAVLRGNGVARRAVCVFWAMMFARGISATANWAVNRKAVFASDAAAGASFAKYCLLAAIVFVSGYILTAAAARILDADGLAVTVVKIAMETGLFFLSYGAQRRWVFAPRG